MDRIEGVFIGTAVTSFLVMLGAIVWMALGLTPG